MESNNSLSGNEYISEDSVFTGLMNTIETRYSRAWQWMQYYKQVFQLMLDGKNAGQTFETEDFENPSINKGKWIDAYADNEKISKTFAYFKSDSFQASFHLSTVYTIIVDILGNILENPEHFYQYLNIIQSIENNPETIKNMMVEEFLSKDFEIQEDIYRSSPEELEKFREDPTYVPKIPSTDINSYINHESFDIVFEVIIKDIHQAVPYLGRY